MNNVKEAWIETYSGLRFYILDCFKGWQMIDSSITLELHNRQQGWVVIREILYPFVKRWLQAEKTLIITAELKKRTKKQNRRYWGRGVLAQIAEQATVNRNLERAPVVETKPVAVTPKAETIARAPQSDAPMCYSCGNSMQRAGSCYVCSSCGATSGCS